MPNTLLIRNAETNAVMKAKIAAAFPEVDRLFREWAEKQPVPGAAWGVVVDGGLVHAGAFGVRDVATQAPVVGLSPIIGGSHVHGMAVQMLTSIGVEVSAAGVGLHYGARSAGGVLDGWLVDTADESDLGRLHEAGLAAAAVPLLMTDHDATAAMAAAALDLVTR